MSHLLLRVEYIHDAVENSEYVGALFLDVVKAFVTVWCSDHIYKMINLKFPITYVQFLLSSLCNRAQRSKLGSLLYKIYIHDILVHPRTLMAIYVDATTIMPRNKNTDYMHVHLQVDISRLENFFNKYRIKVRPNK